MATAPNQTRPLSHKAPSRENRAGEGSRDTTAESNPFPTEPSYPYQLSTHIHPIAFKCWRWTMNCFSLNLSSKLFTFLVARLSKETSKLHPKARNQIQIEANSRESYTPSHDTDFQPLSIPCRDNIKTEQIPRLTLWLRVAPCQKYSSWRSWSFFILPLVAWIQQSSILTTFTTKQ